MLTRRAFAGGLTAAAAARATVAVPGVAAAAAPGVPALIFPADFGAHAERHVEWWYVTGALEAAPGRVWGFQITFFRVATGLAAGEASGFAARELVFAHAALTDLEARRLRHDQRIARAGYAAEAGAGDTRVGMRDWTLRRSGGSGPSRYAAAARSESAGFAFTLALEATQPLLLQGIDGLSQKGPRAEQSSHYYSEPQLAVRGSLQLDGRSTPVTGTAWLDHEWSDSYLDREAVGWDWIGMNLDDGSALTAFRLRRADGSTLWTGGSHRPRGGAVRNFADGEAGFTPLRTWRSPASAATYPVAWRIATPAGTFEVRALQDDQELDSRASTGAIYWEGLSLLLDANGRRVGRGYLEMTGYAARLVL